jgi:hypothetical protein
MVTRFQQAYIRGEYLVDCDWMRHQCQLKGGGSIECTGLDQCPRLGGLFLQRVDEESPGRYR